MWNNFREKYIIYLIDRMLTFFQSFVKDQLEECRKSDAEQYLKNLYDLYTRYAFNY